MTITINFDDIKNLSKHFNVSELDILNILHSSSVETTNEGPGHPRCFTVKPEDIEKMLKPKRNVKKK